MPRIGGAGNGVEPDSGAITKEYAFSVFEEYASLSGSIDVHHQNGNVLSMEDGAVAQLGERPVLALGGQRFDPFRLHHFQIMSERVFEDWACLADPPTPRRSLINHDHGALRPQTRSPKT